MKKKSLKVLILTASGGGGHLQLASAKKEDVLLSNPDAMIIEKDVITQWFGKRSGGLGVYIWNKGQKKGIVSAAQFLLTVQRFFEHLFWPKFFIQALYTFLKEDVDRIIDTQPIGISPIMKALCVFNKIKNKEVVLEKYVVDLPTKHTKIYFKGIKKLPKKQKEFFKLFTLEPLLEKGETDRDFWKKNCGLLKESVFYEKYPIRNIFKKYQHKKRKDETFFIPIYFKELKQAELMQKSFQRGKIEARFQKDHFKFQIDPDDKLITLLLGSQTVFHSTLSYIEEVINLIKSIDPVKKTRFHLFVFCGEYNKKNKELFQAVNDLVQNQIDYPQMLSIIPMSFQKEDVIASLYFRSDITITKSGGATSMELLCVGQGEIFIHSGIKKTATRKNLLKGFPTNELGSALYLEKKAGAKIITPELLCENCKAFFLADKAC